MRQLAGKPQLLRGSGVGLLSGLQQTPRNYSSRNRWPDLAFCSNALSRSARSFSRSARFIVSLRSAARILLSRAPRHTSNRPAGSKLMRKPWAHGPLPGPQRGLRKNQAGRRIRHARARALPKDNNATTAHKSNSVSLSSAATNPLDLWSLPGPTVRRRRTTSGRQIPSYSRSKEQA